MIFRSLGTLSILLTLGAMSFVGAAVAQEAASPPAAEVTEPVTQEAPKTSTGWREEAVKPSPEATSKPEPLARITPLPPADRPPQSIFPKPLPTDEWGLKSEAKDKQTGDKLPSVEEKPSSPLPGPSSSLPGPSSSLPGDGAEPLLPIGPSGVPRGELFPNAENDQQDDQSFKRPSEAGIQVDRLDETALVPVGVAFENRPVGPNAWENMSADDWLAALKAIKIGSISPSAARFARSLILSPTTPPVGLDMPTFLAARIEALRNAGYISDALLLIDQARLTDAGWPLVRTELEDRLLLKDLAGACRRLDAARNQGFDGSLDVVALCHGLRGEPEAARLALEIWEEAGQADRRRRSILLNLAAGRGSDASLIADVPFARDIQTAALDFALADIGQLTFQNVGLESEEPDDALSLGHAAAVWSRPEIDPLYRLTLGERAAAIGAVPEEALAQAYLTATLPSIAEAEIELPGTLERASLYRQIAYADDNETRVRLLHRLMLSADRDGVIVGVARAASPLLADAEPDEVTITLAPTLARSLVHADAIAALPAWYRTARREAARSGPSGEDLLLTVWPLALISNPAARVPYSDEIWRLWWERQTQLGGTDMHRRGLLFLTLLDRLGYQPSADLWALVDIESVERSGDALGGPDWRNMLQASERGSAAEALFSALAALGPDSTATRDINMLGEVVGALNRVGLTAEARILAAEALVHAGF
ncbi:MAG: hypothetical protein AAGF15_06195 [Pseudomonadota bacterium]